MITLKRALLIISFALALCTGAYATETRLNWVEVDISPHQNGKATLVYKIRKTVLSGALHGFYFEGFNGAEPNFDYAKCAALDSAGRKYGLSITPVDGGKYDVVLANGAAISSGYVTYILVYDTDLYDAGMLGYTKSKFGNLVYLDWAPVQWEQPAEHETIYLHYPIKTQGRTVNKAFLKKVGFKTEKFMNINYLISYYGQPYNGKYYLTVRLHKKNPPSRYHMMVKCYIDAKYFNLKPRQAAPTPQGSTNSTNEGYPSEPNYPSSNPREEYTISPISVLLGFGVVAFILIMLIRWKMSTFSASAEQLEGINWERGDWVPPKIKVSSFRQPGKVAELEPVEAALLLDVPLAKILGTIIAHMEHEGLVKVLSLDPIRLERLFPIGVVPANMYEDILWNGIRDEGKLDDAEMKALFKEISDKTQAKAWDCDLEATKDFYRKQIKEQYERVQRGETDVDGAYDSWGHAYSNYYAYYFYSSFIGGPMGRADEISRAVETQTDFGDAHTIAPVSVDACHDACYVHTACHDACHDACHSACHDACHSACHDACHSACVSGGDH